MTDPLGLTPEQREWSDLAKIAERETPSWWTPEIRDNWIMLRYLERVMARRRARTTNP